MNSIRQIINITDSPNKSNRNSPKNNHNNNETRSNSKSNHSLRIRNTHIRPNDFIRLGGESSFKFEGDIFLLWEFDLGGTMGCREGCECDECGIQFFSIFVIILFFDNFGIETCEFGS